MSELATLAMKIRSMALLTVSYGSINIAQNPMLDYRPETRERIRRDVARQVAESKIKSVVKVGKPR